MEAVGVLIVLCVVAFVPFAPNVYKKLYDKYSSRAKREMFLREMENSGNPELKERAYNIRLRDARIALGLMETEQATKILNSKAIREKLEMADINVEKLSAILMTNEEVNKLLNE